MATGCRLSAIQKPVLSVSIPADQREAFYRALLRLREDADQPFPTISALIVRAVLTAAQATTVVSNGPSERPS